MPKVTMESATDLFVAVDVLVDRLVAHLSQRVLGKPSKDSSGAPLFCADLEFDEIPEFLINASYLSLPRLSVLLGRHEIVVLCSHSDAAEFAPHSRKVLPNGGGNFFETTTLLVASSRVGRL